MTHQRRLALVAAAATMLASTALASVYQSSGFILFLIDQPNWFLYVAAGVAAVTGASIGARALRAPIWMQPLAGLGGLLLYVTVVFGEGALLGIVPLPGTFASLNSQITFAFHEIAEMSAPVPVHRGLLLLAVLGVGLIAILVDTFAVTLQRASLAGLPLLVLYAVPVSIDRQGLSWWMFAFGAAGYLWLLVTDQLDRVSRWGRPFRQSPREAFAATSLGSTGRWVGAFGIVIAALIPVFVPGISTTGWFDGQFGSGGERSVETINPITQLKGQLTQREEVELLRLQTNDKTPFYLRLTTLDQYSERGWTQRTLSAAADQRLRNGITDENGISAALQRVRQRSTINIERFGGSSYLPLFANPAKVSVDGDWRWDDRADTAFSSRANTRGLKYTFDSQRIEYDARQLMTAPDLGVTSSQVKDYTGTSGPVAGSVRTLVDGLVNGKKTQYERVVAINDYFGANDFVYSTSTTPGTSGSDLVDFLTNKRGYCEQYASAMAYLVRAVGIPARVAIGFGYGKDAGSYTRVTNHDAHAWVEVYFSGAGWVPFDPTPPDGTGRTGGLAWTKAPAEAAPGATPSAGPTDPNAGQPQGQAPNDPAKDKDLDQGAPTAKQDGPETFSLPAWTAPLFGLAGPVLNGHAVPQLPAWLWWMLALAAILGLAAVPSLWRLESRRIRLAHVRSVNPLVSAHSAWDEVTDTLLDVGLPAADAETPRTIASQLVRLGLSAEAQAAAWSLASAEEEVLYAPRAVLAGHPSDRAAAVAATQLVCGEILAHSAQRVRWRARLLPPSFLTRASRTLTEIGETMSIGATEGRTAIGRLIPRRT